MGAVPFQLLKPMYKPKSLETFFTNLSDLVSIVIVLTVLVLSVVVRLVVWVLSAVVCAIDAVAANRVIASERVEIVFMAFCAFSVYLLLFDG